MVTGDADVDADIAVVFAVELVVLVVPPAFLNTVVAKAACIVNLLPGSR